MLVKKSNKYQIGSARSLVVALFLLVSLLVSGWLFINRQYVLDTIAARSFEPTDSVANLAEQTTMTDFGELMYYASKPELQVADDFNKECQQAEATSAVLGCYVNRRIYLYDIKNDELAGIKETTAAHEMLHAAYERLSVGEQQRIGQLLDAEQEKLKDDAKFAERMATYDRIEPGARLNELHSIVATEIEVIAPELEEYYAKYFSSRAKIVQFHKTYSEVFHDLELKSEQLTSQMTQLTAEISDAKAQYDSDALQLEQSVSDFNQKAESGYYKRQTEFNANRQALVARSNRLDFTRQSINSKIDRFNQLQKQRESIAIQVNELNSSIDSRIAPAPGL